MDVMEVSPLVGAQFSGDLEIEALTIAEGAECLWCPSPHHFRGVYAASTWGERLSNDSSVVSRGDEGDES